MNEEKFEGTTTNLTIEPINEKDIDKAIEIMNDYKSKEAIRIRKALNLCATILDRIDYNMFEVNQGYIPLNGKPTYYCMSKGSEFKPKQKK